MNIVEVVKPRMLLLENVKNLTCYNEGKMLRYIINYIQNQGYKIKYKVINTCEYSNIAQNRERIYILLKRKIAIILPFQVE